MDDVVALQLVAPSVNATAWAVKTFDKVWGMSPSLISIAVYQ